MSAPPVSRPSLPPEARLAFPLDVESADEARIWVQRLAGVVGLFKVGLELFVADGAPAIEAVHEAGAACFLDLKLHDIPATVAGAVRSAVRHRVRYLTIHAAGGASMMRAAVEAAAGSETQLLAVTVLTSMDAVELEGVGETRSARDLVLRRAELAVALGVPGLVTSPEECALLRQRCGSAVSLVIPGIRPAGTETGDQKRVGTPESALAAGADILVVGRPIRHAPDPAAAARALLEIIRQRGGA